MRRPDPRLRAVLVAALLVGAVPVTSGCLQMIRGEPDPWPAPAFSVTDTAGKPHNLTDYEGRVLVVDLMATWCGPCKAQMPHLQTIREAYGEDEVAMISVGVDPSESNEDLRRFADEYHGTWPFARDTDDVRGKLNLRMIPKLVIIDAHGNVVFETSRETYPAALARVINKHVEA